MQVGVPTTTASTRQGPAAVPKMQGGGQEAAGLQRLWRHSRKADVEIEGKISLAKGGNGP